MCGSGFVSSDPKQTYSDAIEKLLKDLKFGSITLVVQDGKVIQIEKNEKFRVTSSNIR